MRVCRPRHIFIDAETTAKGPVEVNLGEMGSAQRIYFTVEIKPVADDEILESVQASCSCVRLETKGPSPLLADGSWFTGYFDVPWTAVRPESSQQVLKLRTSYRTLSVQLDATGLPIGGSPEVLALAEVNISASASDPLRWAHSLPPGARILRREQDARWAAMGLNLQIDETEKQPKIIVTLDADKACGWFRDTIKQYPHTEQPAWYLLYQNESKPASFAALNVQLSLTHPGPLVCSPGKIDFGALHPGEIATRHLELSSKQASSLQLSSSGAVHVRPLPDETAGGKVASFEITLDAGKLPAPIRPGFAGGMLLASLSNGNRQLIPYYFAILPHNLQ